MSNGFDISFDKGTINRGAYRAEMKGLAVRLSTGGYFEVKDISVSGISITSVNNVGPDSDKVVLLDLYVSGKLYLPRIKAKKLRGSPGGVTIYTFQDLDRQQEDKISKLILSIQKRIIELRKIKREKE